MQKPEPSYFTRFFQSDRAILLLCMGISLTFWTLTELSQSYKTTQDCKLIYQLPENRILANDAPEKIKVTMEGLGWDLMSNYFRKKNRQLALELNSNHRQIYNSSQLINKLSAELKSIDVKGLNIDFLELIVEERLSKKVPVQLDAELLFDPSYHLKRKPFLQPDSVLLTGPASLLQNLDNWPTVHFKLEQIDSDKEQQLLLIPPSQKSLVVKPTEILMHVEVEQLTEKTFFVPVQVKNGPDSIKIFPENIKISCVLGLSVYDQINSNDFVLEVDMAGIALKEENNTLPVLLSHQPEQVRGVHLSHQSVEFFFVENLEDIPE